MTISRSTDQTETCCGSCDAAPGLGLPRQLAWLQGVTLAWMAVECALALMAASRAHSLALLAFGADSLIEFLSAIVVLLQFLPGFQLKKLYAERAAAALLLLLAVAVVAIALIGSQRPMETSCLGIIVTIAALIAMPVLAWLKRRQARALNNRALSTDATQSATCAYLAAVTLAGVSAYAIWRVAWVDTVAALAAVPIVLVEARRAWRGEACGCGT